MDSFITKLEKGFDFEASCDPWNKIELDTNRFKEYAHELSPISLVANSYCRSAAGACRDHLELRRLKKRATNHWDWKKVDYVDGQYLQWGFNWNDKGEKCELNCDDLFSAFEFDEKCENDSIVLGYDVLTPIGIWKTGMSRVGTAKTECGIASYSVDRPDRPTCFEFHADGAPRGQKEINEEGGSGTSVDQAIDQFCNDLDGQQVFGLNDESKRMRVRRWGYAEFKIPERRSFWLKAEYAARPYCAGYEFIHKTNCKAALSQGMSFCAAERPRTKGFSIHGIGCIDYSVHVTDNVFDDSPPWRAPVLRFPPPDDATKKGGGGPNPLLCRGFYSVAPITEEDFNKAIDAFCKDGSKIVGYGKKLDNMMWYPPQNDVPFYPGKFDQRLNMGAETVNNGAPEPYEDMKNC